MEGATGSSEDAAQLQLSDHETAVLDSLVAEAEAEAPAHKRPRKEAQRTNQSSHSVTSAARGNKRLSFAARAEIIALVESKAHTWTRKQIAEKYGITTARISQILNAKERRRVGEELERGICPHRKRVCAPKFALLEQRLLQWIKRTIVANSLSPHPSVRNPLSMPAVCSQAKQLAKELNLTDFTGSNGWFTRFKERYGLAELARISRDMNQPHAKAAIAAAALRYSASQGIPSQALLSQVPHQEADFHHAADDDEEEKENHQVLQAHQAHQEQQEEQERPLGDDLDPLGASPPQYHVFSVCSRPPPQAAQPQSSASKRSRTTATTTTTITTAATDSDPQQPDETIDLSAVDADAFLDRFTQVRAELSSHPDPASLISSVVESLLKSDATTTTPQAAAPGDV